MTNRGSGESMAGAKTGPRVPEGFWQHIRSLGPGLVVALT